MTSQHIKLSSTKTNTMTVSAETFSLSALLRSKSIGDTTQVDLIDDNARLPSKELLVQLGLKDSISSIATVDEDVSIYSKHDPLMVQALQLGVPGSWGWSMGETKTEYSVDGGGGANPKLGLS